MSGLNGTGATNSSADLTQLQADIATAQAAAVAAGLGVGQTWQDVTASRLKGIRYTNSTGKPIVLYFGTGSGATTISIDSLTESISVASPGNRAEKTLVIPDGSTYKYNYATHATFFWELR